MIESQYTTTPWRWAWWPSPYVLCPALNTRPPDLGPNWLPDADGPGAECRRDELLQLALNANDWIEVMHETAHDFAVAVLALWSASLRGWGNVFTGWKSSAPCEWWQRFDALHVMAGREMNARCLK